MVGSVFVALGACGSNGPDTEVFDITFDACEPIAITLIGASPIQEASADDALLAWRGRGVTAFDPPTTASGSALEIRFEAASAPFHGLYDDEHGVVYINRGLGDRDALAIVIAHELGHSFGLHHVDRDERSSLMNPGNLQTPLTDADQIALEALWGRCD